MSVDLRNAIKGLLISGICLAAGQSYAATAEQALKLSPLQKGVDFDRPAADEIAKCTIKPEKIGAHTGWMVRNGNGELLRQFLDTNGDNVVDQWCYFKDGIEVYRDIDSNFNNKADQYRWLNTAGGRWGIDTNEDGVIDVWQCISPEELATEVVLALRDRDADRFNRLLITSAELKSLGLSAAKSAEIGQRVAAAPKQFAAAAETQKVVDAKATNAHFEAAKPGVVPAGTGGSTKDIMVYENALAIADGGGQDSQITLGAVVRVGDAWRLVSSPVLPDGSGKAVEPTAMFIPAPARSTGESAETATGGPNEKVRPLLADLQKLEEAVGQATGDEANKINDRRADLYYQIVSAADEKDRGQYLRQMADVLSAAVQSGNYSSGPARLKQLSETLTKEAKSQEQTDLAAYVQFRAMTADYAASLQAPGADFAKIQTAWLESLEKFATAFPKSSDTSDAMLQLGIAEEFAGQEEKAKKWYGLITTNFPDSAASRKAAGAANRLNSVGKPITLTGKSVTGETVSLADLKGKVVLIHYWATWCEPCKVDIAQLKELQAKYGNGFALLGVSLDSSRTALDSYLATNRIPWPQLYEPGGLDSRLANELGVLTLPTMILVDAEGKVLNRGIHITELDGELKNRIKQ